MKIIMAGFAFGTDAWFGFMRAAMMRHGDDQPE